MAVLPWLPLANHLIYCTVRILQSSIGKVTMGTIGTTDERYLLLLMVSCLGMKQRLLMIDIPVLYFLTYTIFQLRWALQ